MKACHLHVGAGKTGSSAIQYVLTKAHDALLRRGYLYPDAGGNFKAVLAHRPTPGNAYKIFQAVRDGNERSAIEALEPFSTDPADLILSCEGFSNLSPPALANFGEALRSLGYAPRCLVFFRPQADNIVSSYLQQVKAARISRISLEGYANRELTEHMHQKWNWLKRANKLESSFGDVTVKWYPAALRSGGVVKATLDWLGLNLDLSTPIVNHSPNSEALIIIREVNALGSGGKRFADEFLARVAAAGLLGGSRVALSGETRRKIDAATHAGNTELLERYCPDLVAHEELAPAPEQPPEPIDAALTGRLRALAATLRSS